jgi:hypothetical protein
MWKKTLALTTLLSFLALATLAQSVAARGKRNDDAINGHSHRNKICRPYYGGTVCHP